jgi:signal transduction histidine kinase
VEREARNGLVFAQKARFGFAIDAITVQLRLIRTLRGRTPKFGSFDDGQFEELRFEQHLAGDPALAQPECSYWIRKLQVRFLAGDHACALDAASRARRLLWSVPSNLETADYHFYSALSHSASWDCASPEQKLEHLEALAAHNESLEIWAENCPDNFENRVALVGAEIARIEGRTLAAEQLYEQAIRSAHANGFVHNEALANELAGRFYAARGLEKIAQMYLRDARYCYVRWDADGKVRQLDQLYPHLRQEQPLAGPTSTISTSVEHLDLATVIKLSQAISGEIVLEKLIDTLMRTAIEHAGAERGLLIVARGDEYRIVAEATAGGDTVAVGPRQASATAADLPVSVLHYVVRTKESVLLHDSSGESPFSADDYIRRHHARSILCLPLLKEARLVGVVYLENNLAQHVFTPDRMVVLKLLASQAAISLENIRLYGELQEREQAARDSERRYLEVEVALAHANRLATVGQLSASVAHEVNQPIAAAVTNAHAALRWLEAQPPDTEEVRQALGRIIRNGNRAGEVIGRIRALLKKAPPKKDNLQMNEAIREVIALTQGDVVRSGVSLQLQLAEALPLIQGDRVQLQQVILNLMVNAIEAMSGVSEGLRELCISTAVARSADVLVTVQDSGPGLDAASLERVFEAFYTTKRGGLGIGLSICRSIVEAHGGRLWASASVPRGAMFQFTLPVPLISK